MNLRIGNSYNYSAKQYDSFPLWKKMLYWMDQSVQAHSFNTAGTNFDAENIGKIEYNRTGIGKYLSNKLVR